MFPVFCLNVRPGWENFIKLRRVPNALLWSPFLSFSLSFLLSLSFRCSSLVLCVACSILWTRRETSGKPGSVTITALWSASCILWRFEYLGFWSVEVKNYKRWVNNNVIIRMCCASTGSSAKKSPCWKAVTSKLLPSLACINQPKVVPFSSGLPSSNTTPVHNPRKRRYLYVGLLF